MNGRGKEMFDILRKIFKTGTVTQQDLFQEAPSRFRGKPVILQGECTGCQRCVHQCPSHAIQLIPVDGKRVELTLSYAQCIFCGICREVCEPQIIQVSQEYRMATRNTDDLLQRVYLQMESAPQLVSIGKEK